MPEDQLKAKLAKIEEELRRKKREMSSIQQIGQALSSELRTRKLLVLIMKELTSLMNADRSTFYVVDNERGELWSIIAQQAEIKEIRLKIGTGIAGHVAKTGETINIPDAYADSRFDPTTDKKTGYHTRSILCMPIFEPLKKTGEKPETIGVLQVLNKKDGVFDHEDEELLKSLASPIAVALINSRLYTALEQKVNELHLLFNIEREINRAYSLQELLEMLIQHIAQTLNVEAALIALLDENDREVKHLALSNLPAESSGKIRAAFAGGLWKEVVRDGKLQIINDAGRHSHLENELLAPYGIQIRQMVCAPLKIGEQVVGVLELYNKKTENDFFRSDDVQLIQSLNSQISRSIENIRLREEKIKADRLAAIGNMMGSIVHDLRTPLNNIYGFVDLMQDEEDPDIRNEYKDIIDEQIKILTNMTTDVLDFAKGKTTVLPIKYPVNKILDDFTRFNENHIRAKGFLFETACNTQSMIYVDPEKMNRVFTNIMKNALEAMESGGTFSLIANQVDGEIEFLLSDTGKGIPEEIRHRLFDSFVTSGKKEGTGLGLAIVKKVIDQHKGRIEVESTPGKGTTFKIYIKRL